MKRLLSVLLTVLTAASLFFSCAEENVGEIKETGSMSTNEGTSEAEQNVEAVLCRTTYGYDKVRGDAVPSSEQNTSGELYLAKNEAEGIQLCLYCEKDISDVTVGLKSGDVSGIECSLYTVRYVSKDGGEQKFSDPMVDLDEGDKLRLKANETLCIYAEFKTSKDAPAGKHAYSFEVKDGQGEVIADYNIEVTVWDFSYSDAPALDTALGFWGQTVKDWYGHYNDSYYKLYYDYLLEHKLSCYGLPYEILDERADAYMSDPRVTSFKVPFDPTSPDHFSLEYIDQIYEKLSTNPVWMEKAYLYVLDEPWNEEHFEFIRKNLPEYKERWPQFKICVPFYENKTVDGKNQLEFISQYADQVCPVLPMLGTEDKYPDYADRLEEIKESGQRVWTYVSNFVNEPYNNFYIDMSGLQNRAVFWQTYQHNIDGFLYWSPAHWVKSDSYKGDVWKDGGEDYEHWGDGILLYPGCSTKFAYEFRRIAPLPSIRLKIVRDGIEDYELLKMAEEKFGRAWVDERINKVTPSLTEISVDDEGFDAIRREIGNALSGAVSNGG